MESPNVWTENVSFLTLHYEEVSLVPFGGRFDGSFGSVGYWGRCRRHRTWWGAVPVPQIFRFSISLCSSLLALLRTSTGAIVRAVTQSDDATATPNSTSQRDKRIL